MKTIAQIIHQKTFPMQILDTIKHGKVIYWEDVCGRWIVKEYSEDGLRTIYTDSEGFLISNKS